MKIKHYSASSLLLHQKNPRRWCLRYLEGIKDPPTAALDLGTRLHSYIEGRMRHRRAAHLLDESSQQVVETWVRNELVDPLTYNLEYEFYCSLGPDLPPVMGRIDVWRRKGRVLEVWDHKTCNPAYALTEDELEVDWQLNLYAHALDPLCSQEMVEVRHNQFMKNRAGAIEKYRVIKKVLTKKSRSGIINSIKQEIEAAQETIALYRAQGLQSIRATPEHKYWYGKVDTLWPIIVGQIDIKTFKENYDSTKQVWSF